MSPAEEPVVVPLPAPSANGEGSNEGSETATETVDRRVFPTGQCSHQAKKSLVKGKNWKETTKKDRAAKGRKCIECVRKAEKEATAKIVDVSPTMCLTCGSRLCESHAIAHSKAVRSGEEHPFYYDQDDDSVRCFSCEVIVDTSSAPHVNMVLNELKSLWKNKGKDEKSGDKASPSEDKPMVLDKPDIKPESKPEKKPKQNGTTLEEGKKTNGFRKTLAGSTERVSSEGVETNGTTGAVEKSRNGGLSLLPSTAIPAKGLTNLGNTCFFNSVMQCMLQTHQLAYYCDRFGRVTRLSFPKQAKPMVVNDEKVEIEEATLSIRAKPTPLNDALKTFLVDFRNLRTPSPSNLFNQISYKAARFRSMAQQDAHELLRYLLDGLCSEETARYQEAIAELVGAPLKSADKVDKTKQQKAKAYLQVAGRPLLDAVFGGRLLQTIRCSKCAHVSVRYENLYDLSVPLTGGSNERSGPYRSYGKQRLQVDPTQSSSTDSPSNKPLSKHQLKKKEKEKRATRKNSRTLKTQTSKTGEEEATIESKTADLRVKDEETPTTDDDEADEKADEAKVCKEKEKEMKIEELESSSGNEEERPTDSYRPEENKENLLDLTKVLTTMKTSLPSGQSIAASLLEFTAEERLEGTNAYECEKCCTPGNKKKGATGKDKTRVEATKRYLIATPPVVLTIHVKRFQQTHGFNGKMTTRKVSGHVHFPLIFDIAPFCCKNVERISPGQSSILYSLYGVVSHSGNLSGGHYVAYVKSRARIERTEEMLEAARALCADVQAEPPRLPSPTTSQQPPLKPEDAAKEVPTGTWYYCSDSRVSSISESKVLQEEAYLLFYERIY